MRRYLPKSQASDEQVVDALASLYRVYHRLGITSIVERAIDVHGYGLYRKLSERRDPPMRVAICLRIPAETRASSAAGSTSRNSTPATETSGSASAR